MNPKLILFILGSVLAVGLIAAGISFGVSHWLSKSSSGTGMMMRQVNFVETGTLLKDSPGMKSGVWFIVYEQPGSPALAKELTFTHEYADVHSGQRGRIEGYESNEVVEVRTLEILNARKKDVIWVESPLPDASIINPITVTGYAKGYWYFEASFPIKVLDANGKLLGQTTAKAAGDWMTNEYVQFFASIPFIAPSTATGTLVLESDNPSGLLGNTDALRIPVTFSQEGRAIKLYYYDPDRDKSENGNVSCSERGLVPVDRQIAISQTPIEDTIRLLIQGGLTEEERSRGIVTEYPLPGLSLRGSVLKDDVLTLEFDDPHHKTSGGACRVTILAWQIVKTAKQFPGIHEIKFKPEWLFQP